MSDLFTPVASIKFKWSDTAYDYFIPAGLSVAAGDKVIVPTRGGEKEVVVIEVKASSEKATASIIRRVEEMADAEEEQG